MGYLHIGQVRDDYHHVRYYLDGLTAYWHHDTTAGINQNTHVEYVIQDYDKPLGVATYKTSDEMPENLKQTLSDIEETAIIEMQAKEKYHYSLFACIYDDAQGVVPLRRI